MNIDSEKQDKNYIDYKIVAVKLASCVNQWNTLPTKVTGPEQFVTYIRELNILPLRIYYHGQNIAGIHGNCYLKDVFISRNGCVDILLMYDSQDYKDYAVLTVAKGILENSGFDTDQNKITGVWDHFRLIFDNKPLSLGEFIPYRLRRPMTAKYEKIEPRKRKLFFLSSDINDQLHRIKSPCTVKLTVCDE